MNAFCGKLSLTHLTLLSVVVRENIPTYGGKNLSHH